MVDEEVIRRKGRKYRIKVKTVDHRKEMETRGHPLTPPNYN